MLPASQSSGQLLFNISAVEPHDKMATTTDTVAKLVQEFLQRDDAVKILGTAGLTVVFLVWAYYRYLATPDLSFIPRAGKAPGPLGFGLNDVKRDFAKNGTKIINDGYRQVRLRETTEIAQPELTDSLRAE